MTLYEHTLKKIFFLQDPEKVHERIVRLGKVLGSNLLTRTITGFFLDYDHPSLHQEIKGLFFRNPLGLAAGFDKDCDLLKIIGRTGFSFEEAGSITLDPYEGNPRPRVIRIPEHEGLIVNYGLKSKGAEAIAEKLSKYSLKELEQKYKLILGLSIAKSNKRFSNDKERISSFTKAYSLLFDKAHYHTINISCPNTFEHCSYFHEPILFEKLLKGLKKEIAIIKKKNPSWKKPPLFIKVSPDLSENAIIRLLKISSRFKDLVDGWVIANLTKDRSVLGNDEKRFRSQPGGISGRHLKDRSLRMISIVRRELGPGPIIIGVGGVFTPQDAYDKILAGANLVQLITGMIYKGPTLMKNINKGLVSLLERDGYSSISEAVGKGTDRFLKNHKRLRQNS